jgi:hypothetical protein
MEALMRIHYMPQWVPVSFQPVKKAVKPRKFFHTEEASETAESGNYAPPISSLLDEETEDKRTDIFA